jgi:hypothetical protein
MNDHNSIIHLFDPHNIVVICASNLVMKYIFIYLYDNHLTIYYGNQIFLLQKGSIIYTFDISFRKSWID